MQRRRRRGLQQVSSQAFRCLYVGMCRCPTNHIRSNEGKAGRMRTTIDGNRGSREIAVGFILRRHPRYMKRLRAECNPCLEAGCVESAANNPRAMLKDPELRPSGLIADLLHSPPTRRSNHLLRLGRGSDRARRAGCRQRRFCPRTANPQLRGWRHGGYGICGGGRGVYLASIGKSNSQHCN